MRLKMNYHQADCLCRLFQLCIIPVKPADIAESLVYDIMVQIFKKLRNKVEAIKPGKDGYSVTLTQVEAKAYYVYFHTRELGVNYRYEANFIQQHINQIDQIYA